MSTRGLGRAVAASVLLHGVAAAGGADDWRPAMAVLSKSFRVLAPDMLSWAAG